MTLIEALKAYLITGGICFIAALTYAMIRINPPDDTPEATYRDDHGPRK